jgi:hypothetical protein
MLGEHTEGFRVGVLGWGTRLGNKVGEKGWCNRLVNRVGVLGLGNM